MEEERDEWSVARVAPLMTVMHCVARFRVDDSVHLFLFPAIGPSFLSPVLARASAREWELRPTRLRFGFSDPVES